MLLQFLLTNQLLLAAQLKYQSHRSRPYGMAAFKKRYKHKKDTNPKKVQSQERYTSKKGKT